MILCGPGASLSTFTSNPEEFPKALIPIANRPMVWYPLDWCYRMGVTGKLRKEISYLSTYISKSVVLRYRTDLSLPEVALLTNSQNSISPS